MPHCTLHSTLVIVTTPDQSTLGVLAVQLYQRGSSRAHNASIQYTRRTSQATCRDGPGIPSMITFRHQPHPSSPLYAHLLRPQPTSTLLSTEQPAAHQCGPCPAFLCSSHASNCPMGGPDSAVASAAFDMHVDCVRFLRLLLSSKPTPTWYLTSRQANIFASSCSCNTRRGTRVRATVADAEWLSTQPQAHSATLVGAVKMRWDYYYRGHASLALRTSTLLALTWELRYSRRPLFFSAVICSNIEIVSLTSFTRSASGGGSPSSCTHGVSSHTVSGRAGECLNGERRSG